MLRKLMRRPLFTLILLLNLVLILYFIFTYNSEENQFFEENYLQIGDGHDASVHPGAASFRDAPGVCHLPIDVSPFDASIEQFFEVQPKQITCSLEQDFRPLTYIDENLGQLRQNRSEDECYYWTLRKHSHNDVSIDYGPKLRLDPLAGVVLQEIENYLAVQCNNDAYTNVHYWLNGQAKAATVESFKKSQSTEKPSVIILVIESLSRLNYLRYLNSTQIILEQQYGNTYYLDGLNKMADNSFPNMVPLLTGRRLYANELDGDENYGPYDDWPFIWKNFSNAGYLTALQEDYPKFTLFNYESKGFKRSKPTDFYPRPYWTHLFGDVKPIMLAFFPFNISPCYKNRVAKVDLFLDQLHHMVAQSRAANLPLFAFSFYIELTHNNFNKAQTIDSHIAKFLAKSKAVLNDSILILMGDHGNRFGSILQTTIGRIEERMPLFAIHLPQKLITQYPSLKSNLELNRKRLATWLDIHEMLKDVINGNYTEVPKSKESWKRAYSPWREEIPFDRSCKSALIPELYCACDRRVTLDQNKNKLAKSASSALVRHLNTLLNPSDKMCHTLLLKQTLRAELIFPSDSTARARGFRQKIEVTIVVSPSEAIFRSRLYRTAHKQTWSVDEDQITRINEYGNQSWCIRQRDLKPFCLCQNRNNATLSETETDQQASQYKGRSLSLPN